MRDAICIFEFAISGETIEHQSKSLVTFDTDRTIEVFIENGANNIS